jgi:hypothetical protein
MRPLRWHKVYWSLGYAYLGVILYLTLTPTPPSGPDVPYADKWEHFLAYGILMAWFGQLLPVGKARLRWALGFAAMGGILEILQGLGGVRHAEWADFAANATGVVLGYIASAGPMGQGLVQFERKFLR